MFHFDPVNLIVVLLAAAGAWFSLRNDSKWHGEWIKRHSIECDEREKTTIRILSELQNSNAHLTTLTSGHHERIQRIENSMDREQRQS